MTSQNNLRDRIAAAITRCPSVNPYVMARAIIDELGLTNEWSFRFEGKDRRYSLNRAEDIRTIGLYGPLEDAAIESRVAGKWEKQ